MSDYSTVKFLGATVINYSCSLGWNDEVSTLSVSLVEDTRDGDAFNPPEPGYPVLFDFLGWQFYGLLERWTRSYSQSGNPTYNLTVVDPRSLLDGVAIILSEYSETVSIPNIVNVYGYLENLYGFGGSGKNESGIPYLLVKQAILAIVNSVSGTGYGGPIRYKGISYGLDISNLPPITSYYRVGGTAKLTLMEVLRDICESGGCEMFFQLESVGSLPIIKLYTISRQRVPNIGVINQFVSTTQGAISKEAGLEMVNDVCAKFLVGGKETNIFYQSLAPGDDGDYFYGRDNTIAPYWGTSLDGVPVYGDGLDLEHTFPIDTRGIQIPGVGNVYYTDVGELLAVLAGPSYWASFLWLNWANQYRIDPSGGNLDGFLELSKTMKINGIFTKIIQTSATTYPHSGIGNPHYMKAYNLKLPTAVNPNIASVLFGLNGTTIVNFNPNLFFNKMPEVPIMPYELYNLLKAFADKYYGKQFMVRVPGVSTKYDTDTLKITYNMLPVESAWLDNEDIVAAQNRSVFPSNFYWISDDSNKIRAYVRFANPALLNLSELTPEDACFSTNGQYIFIKCEVEPDYVFMGANYTDARAIVKIPKPITHRQQPELLNNIIRDFIYKAVDSNLFSGTDAETLMTKLQNASTLPLSYLSTSAILPVLPDMAAIPLESQVTTYGPWYMNTSVGKTEMEQDDSLVPWNYGSSYLMNVAGNAKVQNIDINLQTLEYGAVEYPGIPSVQLGTQLLNTGPYITDIGVNISTNGVTTRYGMKSWSPKFGKLAKYTSDRFFKMHKQMMSLEREVALVRQEAFRRKYEQ